MAQWVKRLPAVLEIWMQSLGLGDLLEEGMTTPSVFLPGVAHGQEPGEL